MTSKALQAILGEEESAKEPTFNYTGHGWEGKNYDGTLDIKEVSKHLKSQLKKEYPKCKFSIQIERYSMGQSLNVSLMEAPFEAIINKGSIVNNEFVSIEEQGHKFEKYAQLNEYRFSDPYKDESACARCTPDGWNNGAILTQEGWDCMKRAGELASSFNFNDSDGMIDYFHTNFYLHLYIGKWDKPFQVV